MGRPMPAQIRRALISVSDKSGLSGFVSALAGMKVEILSTGGTAKFIRDLGIAVRDVSDVTAFPEIMDGRVKTLHPRIHGGLLAKRSDAAHAAAMNAHDIPPIDLLVVNLYPFEETVAKGSDWNTSIENIDIGGPAMIRAAAKNHDDVTVIVDPQDYEPILAEIKTNKGGTTFETRRRLAAKAYGRTAVYDAAISQWFARELQDAAPEFIAFGGRRLQTLRYGENPHQSAAFYKTSETRLGIATARQIQGKELSYNNINDTDAALECVAEFGAGGPAACVIVKHANPCGVAVGASLTEAYEKALRCDPVSAFGGIIALNRQLDRDAALQITKLFTEVIVAPGASEDALAIVAEKTNLRLLSIDSLPDPSAPGLLVKSVGGGLLVQSRDTATADHMRFETVTKRQPTPAEMADLRFAYTVAKHVKSNAIVYAKDGATVGIGAGQMSRLDSARIASRKAEDAAQAMGSSEPLTKDSVVASDAFFPFADGLLQAAEAGATAVVQPGGSVKDAEVIAAADQAGLAMVFTGIRHFRH